MAKSLVDTRDARFVLFEQLETENMLSPELKEEYDLETLEMIVGEAEKLAINVLAPRNKDGDRIGCKFENGNVIAPPSFKKAYDLFVEGGWNGISDSMEVGGQGLPAAIEICCREFFEAANMSFSNYVNLTHGTGKLIEIFGSDEQKRIFLGNLYDGTWCGTMCLTEPDAGSDVGAVKTTAKRNPDGTYSIKGTKIFITGGDHDLVKNIVHMVLARIDGDPEGVRGLSLFIVPKLKVSEGGTGETNDVVCVGIEEKMGLHGSSTCTLNFGDDGGCTGYLLGKERQGIKVMFYMMNEARQLVGSQGLAMGSAAYLEALSYAKERVQGVHFSKAGDPHATPVAIIEHPDIRYTLMRMKAFVEGCRALVYFHAHCMDRARVAASDESKAKWHGMVELFTPVCKAYCCDRGFEVCSAAIQVLGGYGYSNEFPVEQYLRDERITPIYEGTNGIQALDLATRKIVMKKGALFKSFMDEFNQVLDRAYSMERVALYADIVKKYKNILEEGTGYFSEEMRSDDTGTAVAKATRFLEFFGDISLAWLWLWQITIAEKKLEDILEVKGIAREDFDIGSPDTNELAYYGGKIKTGKFYIERIMPVVHGKLEEIKSSGKNYLNISSKCL